MIHEFRNPLPVITPIGKGIVIYVTYTGVFDNDIFTVALKDGGIIRHFCTSQIAVEENGTFNITNDNTN